MLSRRDVLACALALPALAACSRKRRLEAIPAGATVLALGDSLTFGTGATHDTSHPSVLQGLTGWNMVNAGIPGDTSSGALGRLPDLLQQHAPRLVIVGIGGNDFLRRMPVSGTRSNLRAICRQAASGAQVLLIAIPEVNAIAAATRSLAATRSSRKAWRRGRGRWGCSPSGRVPARAGVPARARDSAVRAPPRSAAPSAAAAVAAAAPSSARAAACAATATAAAAVAAPAGLPWAGRSSGGTWP